MCVHRGFSYAFVTFRALLKYNVQTVQDQIAKKQTLEEDPPEASGFWRILSHSTQFRILHKSLPKSWETLLRHLDVTNQQKLEIEV